MTVNKDPKQIRGMFGAIAPRYDLLNHLLSLSIDRYWRWRTRRILAGIAGRGRRVLDLCSGTGDLALSLVEDHQVVGCDFARPMLMFAREKSRRSSLGHRLQLVEADALCLPFADEAFDAVTIAFGLRNLEDYEKGLREMGRVLRVGGTLAVLEFASPSLPGFREVYTFYFTRVLPRLGEWISGRPGSYSYLCRSVREFPDAERLRLITRQAGLEPLRSYSFTGGVTNLHLSRKPAALDATESHPRAPSPNR